jgi:hypothetical protein
MYTVRAEPKNKKKRGLYTGRTDPSDKIGTVRTEREKGIRGPKLYIKKFFAGSQGKAQSARRKKQRS